MKKITIVAHGLGNGGAERVASILANGLNERGYRIQYIAVYNNVITYELNKEIEYIYLNEENPNRLKKYIRRSRKLKQLIKNFYPDFVISFITQEMVWLVLTEKKQYIFSERTNPAKKPKYLRVITDLVYRKSAKIVFQTPGARDYFTDCIKNKSVIIGNPIEDDLPNWDCDNHEKIIMTACRITPEKNLKMLIKSFAECHKKHLDYKLYIYGTPRYPEALTELEELVGELKLKEYVVFPGFSSKIRDIMSKSAMFVMTSDYEGLSNSMLEALCIGVPTICTDCPPGETVRKPL